MQKTLVIVAWISLLAPTGIIQAGELGSQTLASGATDLLAGRLTVRLPKTARLEPRQASIMAATEVAEEETRIVLDLGKERLVMMAYEMYAETGGPLLAEVEAFYANMKMIGKFERLALKAKGIKAVAFIPEAPDLKREAVFFMGVMVASADRTVQYLVFYLNPVGTKDLKGGLKLARAITSSLEPGKRKLKTDGGQRTMSGLDSSYRLTARLPRGYILTKQDGPDFVVHHIRRITRLNMAGANLSIYLGGHPSYQYRQRDKEPKKVESFKAKLFGKDVEWKRWKLPNTPQVNICETIVPLPKKTEFPTQVHVFYQADDERGLSELKATAAGLMILEP